MALVVVLLGLSWFTIQLRQHGMTWGNLLP
jgi:hypothetical protein